MSLYRSEEWLKDYKARIQCIAQNERKRPSTASAQKPTNHTGGRKPIKCGTGKEPNETEKRFNCEHLFGRGLYEAITFNCPGGKYTPDWVFFAEDGQIECYEVKGSHAFHSQGRAAYAFKDCVSRFPKVGFFWAKLEKSGEWTIVDGSTGKRLGEVSNG